MTSATKRLSLFAGLVAVLVMGRTAPAQAANQFNETIPVSGVVYNPCNGHDYAFQGMCHLVGRETIDASGGAHFGFHVNCHVELVDLVTGLRGVGNEEDNYSYNSSGPPPYEFTFTTTFSEIPQGPTDNFIVKGVLHITVNAKGQLTAYVDHFSAECRG
jgi:hypothetical protein